jgi:hypothetical protein
MNKKKANKKQQHCHEFVSSADREREEKNRRKREGEEKEGKLG